MDAQTGQGMIDPAALIGSQAWSANPERVTHQSETSAEMRIAARMALDVPSPDARQAPRSAVDLSTTMRTLGHHGQAVILRDISTLGFMAEVSAFGPTAPAEAFPLEAYVRLTIPGLEIAVAQIVWSRADRVGGRFVTPLDVARLDALLVPPCPDSSHAA